jgi:hypothetical protein
MDGTEQDRLRILGSILTVLLPTKEAKSNMTPGTNPPT